MKLRLLQALIIAFVLACGFTAGYHWPHRDVDAEVHAAFVKGQRDTTVYIEGCTLADAHAERCTIPCGGDQDCVEKNGSRDAY